MKAHEHPAFHNEQLSLYYLQSLALLRMGFRCSLGNHKMHTKSVKDGGGITTCWGVCERCHRGFWQGNIHYPDKWSTLK